MKNLFVYFFFLLIISACQNKKKNSEWALTFTYDTIAVTSKQMKHNGIKVTPAKATVIFPIFKNDTLNQYIKRQVANFYEEKGQIISYEDMANSFVNGYDDYVKSAKEINEQPWILKIDITVLKQSTTYLSLKYVHYDFAGGAHGNISTSFMNYNPQKNVPITIDSLIQKDKMINLIKVAEDIFRRNEKLGATESLEEKYFFDKGKFALAQSFHVDDKGLVFLYVPYEIKPYSEGYTELIIPLSAIKSIAKPNSILTTPN